MKIRELMTEKNSLTTVTQVAFLPEVAQKQVHRSCVVDQYKLVGMVSRGIGGPGRNGPRGHFSGDQGRFEALRSSRRQDPGPPRGRSTLLPWSVNRPQDRFKQRALPVLFDEKGSP